MFFINVQVKFLNSMKNNDKILSDSPFRIDSVEAMEALGKSMGEALVAYDALALIGDLGAGKTHFVKGIAAGIGCDSVVSSPTFPLVHEYSGGRLPLFHFDFYRLESPEALLAIDWDEYTDTEGVIIAEWANKFPELMPENTLWLHFSVTGPTSRVIRVSQTAES